MDPRVVVGDKMKLVSDFKKNDIVYWYPLIKKLSDESKIKIPRTEILATKAPLEKVVWGQLVTDEDQKLIDEFFKDMAIKVSEVGLPCFIRTGQTSAKHYWKNSCYLDTLEQLERHIFNIVEFSHCASLFSIPHNAWAVREFLELNWRFKAFDDMPIGREFRFLIKDHEIIHIQPYWPQMAIEKHIDESIYGDWRNLLRDMNLLNEKDKELLNKNISAVAAEIDGYWSVDFAQDRVGDWWCIDMAVGEDSFIYEPDNLSELILGFR
jgi:hypothetical protein